jgi:hypothetical protein
LLLPAKGSYRHRASLLRTARTMIAHPSSSETGSYHATFTEHVTIRSVYGGCALSGPASPSNGE